MTNSKGLNEQQITDWFDTLTGEQNLFEALNIEQQTMETGK